MVKKLDVFVCPLFSKAVLTTSSSRLSNASTETLLIRLDRRTFVVVHPRATLSLLRQMAPSRNVKVESVIKFRGGNHDEIWHLIKRTPRVV